ncbi:MAG: hypothetical protein JW709_03600 [Sedimentisphaerales bacterium]|nr:hypothetical protein [Sedimentisphaerales bacterium]
MTKIRFKIDEPGHENHLCYLTNLRQHEDASESFLKLVREPKYFCKRCGRAAADKKNLCKPTKL